MAEASTDSESPPPAFFVGGAGFEAARRNHRGYHGHSFRIRLRAAPDAGSAPEVLCGHAARLAGPLDHTLLNEVTDPPDNSGLLEHLEQAATPDLARNGYSLTRVTLFSGPWTGGYRDAEGCVVWLRSRFEAAHQLPNVPRGHPCGRMHGHGFEVVLECAGEDFATLERAWQPVYEQLEGRCLNDFLENPTSELLARWIHRRLVRRVPSLRRVRVHETERSGCSFDGQQYRIWKAVGFEAATRLRNGHAGVTQGLHGHGYRMRLHLEAPLDEVLGWTVDYGDVKRAFEPINDHLDHRQLNGIRGLEDGHTQSLAAWIWRGLKTDLPMLVRLDAMERQDCGVILASDGP